MSSPETLFFASNQLYTSNLPQKNSWHSSYTQPAKLKAVEKIKAGPKAWPIHQTRSLHH
jgi:hypothetical protein